MPFPSFCPIFLILSSGIPISLPCLFVSRYPSCSPDAHSLARANSPFCLVSSFRSHPLCSRFISFFRHSPLRRTRQIYVPLVYLSLLSLPPLFCLCLAPSFSHCSLSLRRRMSPTFESIARFRAHCLPSSPFCHPRARSSSFSTITSSPPPLPPSFLNLPSPPPSLLFPQIYLYHIRHQHYTRALISSVGNSAFLAISLMLYHPLAPSPTLSPPTLSPPRALLRFLRLSIPTRPTHRIVYALRSSARLEYGCLISLCRTQDARIH